MIRLAFKITSFFWIISPFVFIALKLMGIYDFQYDVLVFVFLMLMHSIALFLNYDNHDKEKV